jgi:hypothetical protein
MEINGEKEKRSTMALAPTGHHDAAKLRLLGPTPHHGHAKAKKRPSVHTQRHKAGADPVGGSYGPRHTLRSYKVS